MEENKILEKYKEILHLESMRYVGNGKPETKRYYMHEKCGVLIFDETGKVIVRVPNISGKRRPNKFLYAGPYMLIGNTIYYNEQKTKYHCDKIYYENGILECDKERGFDYNKFFLVKGQALKRAFFRRLNTGDRLDITESTQKNGVIRLRLGGVNTGIYFYGKADGLRLYKSGPMARKLEKLMNE